MKICFPFFVCCVTAILVRLSVRSVWTDAERCVRDPEFYTVPLLQKMQQLGKYYPLVNRGQKLEGHWSRTLFLPEWKIAGHRRNGIPANQLLAAAHS